MTYSLFVLRRAQKELAALPHQSYTRVKQAIEALADNPRPAGCRKLTGRGGWRIRVGELRVIYDIDDQSLKVTVVHIGHRRDVYR